MFSFVYGIYLHIITSSLALGIIFYRCDMYCQILWSIVINSNDCFNEIYCLTDISTIFNPMNLRKKILIIMHIYHENIDLLKYRVCPPLIEIQVLILSFFSYSLRVVLHDRTRMTIGETKSVQIVRHYRYDCCCSTAVPYYSTY